MSALIEYGAAVSRAGDDVASRWSAVLGGYQHNARTAIRWAHPSWLASMFAIRDDAAATIVARICSLPAESSQTDALEACSSALLRLLKLRMPTLDALGKTGVAQLDALPPEAGLGVLRMRALQFRRAEVRRLIDKDSRVRLSEWLGMPLDRLTRVSHATQEASSAPDIARLAAKTAIPPLAMVDAEVLALEGHALLQRDLGVAHSPCPLLRIALPRESLASRGHWLDRVAPGIDADGTAWLITHLAELLPEWPWLSG
ncbi:type III secretion protein HrpB4 [Paraburkholderia sp. ZP32-5]|uniref:type III secretion protein HrpB4 n=1 Tax=Paraburkholderia sp. ZP32-5 TaxID=2883245 RepID=UPI001F34A171|nr:type III secretion protein HrpB4 [Paraburkholderia sp. ZP32-5]